MIPNNDRLRQQPFRNLNGHVGPKRAQNFNNPMTPTMSFTNANFQIVWISDPDVRFKHLHDNVATFVLQNHFMHAMNHGNIVLRSHQRKWNWNTVFYKLLGRIEIDGRPNSLEPNNNLFWDLARLNTQMFRICVERRERDRTNEPRENHETHFNCHICSRHCCCTIVPDRVSLFSEMPIPRSIWMIPNNDRL